MPRYFFDIKDGRRIVDPSGLDCLEDTDLQGETLARQIEADGSVDMDPRHVVVINAEVQQIGKIAVQRAPVGRTEQKRLRRLVHFLALAAAGNRPTEIQPAYKASLRGRGQEISRANGELPIVSYRAPMQVFRSSPGTRSDIGLGAGHLPRGVCRPGRKEWEDSVSKLRIAPLLFRILPRYKAGLLG